MWKVCFKEPRGSYRNYSPGAMNAAYLKVKEMNCSIRKAAREHMIPEATLRNRLTGRVDPETLKSGPPPMFSQEEEAKLTSHLKFMASVGYGYSRSEVIDIATEYAISMGHRDREHPLSLQWYASFMSRWPELKLIKPRGLEVQRAKATSVDCVSKYFSELKYILTKYYLMDKPERIYNVDEKGLSTSHKPPHVITDSCTKPLCITSGTRTNVTVLGCGSALGQQVPPYFVFPGNRMRQELLEGKTPGTSGTVTKSGWSNSEVFKSYLVDHLMKYLPERSPDNPVLLMYDGHRSHVSLDLIDWAKEQNIVIFILPAHTSHILQPMDIGCFGPFEKIYNAMSHKYMREHCGQSITRNNICSISCKAYTSALSAENLQSSFRKAGIYPFNPDIIDQSNFEPSTVLQREESDEVTSVSPSQLPDNRNITPCAAVSEGESENVSPDFFERKEGPIKQKKQAVKKRRYLSYIVSGKAITEDTIVDKIHEHQNLVCKKSKSVKTKSAKTKGKNIQGKQKKSRKQKPSSVTLSPQPGPSHYNIVDTNDSIDDEEDASVTDEEKCCVCHLFQPKQITEAVSLLFTNWAQCDQCGHWVHLVYCTETREVSETDTFLCHHCKEE